MTVVGSRVSGEGLRNAPRRVAPVGQATASRRAILAHWRHELRTPLNAILGYSDVLLEDAVGRGEPLLLNDLARVREAGTQLLELVNSILDAGTIETEDGVDLEQIEARLRHDVRVPLHTILGYTELLLEEVAGRADATFASDLQQIRNACKCLSERLTEVAHLANLAEASGQMVCDPLAENALTSILAPPRFSRRPSGTGRLLVADDSVTNRDVLVRHLARAGYSVAVAETGTDVLRRLDSEPFDLLLLDIMMPEMNGFDVLSHLKSDSQLQHIPVIMISALDEMDSVVRCIEWGAEDYLAKPFDPVLLRARVGSSLERKHFRDREREHLDQLQRERERVEELLLNILPKPIADRLQGGEAGIADSFAEATVLFCDLVGFTPISAVIPAAEVVRRLNRIFSVFDELVERHGLEKIKTIGDAYMVAGGLPTHRPDHAEAVADLALDMMGSPVLRELDGVEPVRLRIGMHFGPVVAGVVGTRKFAYDLWGDTVNTASRMESHGLAGEIQVSECLYQRLQTRYSFYDRGWIPVKGKRRMHTYLLKGRRC